MKYDAAIHHRRSIRLPGYDYALPGAYFVTLCTFHKQCIFGRVVEDRMYENDCGKLAREQWFESAQIRPEFALDAFIVMPNHLHGILWILGPKRERLLVRSGFAQPIVGPSGARPWPNRVRPPDGQTPVGADGVRPPGAQTPVGPSGARPWPNRVCPPDGQTPVGADGVRPPDAQTPVGPNGVRPWPSRARPWPNRARPLAERRSALQTPRNRRGPIPPMRSHSLASWAAGFKSAGWRRPRCVGSAISRRDRAGVIPSEPRRTCLRQIADVKKQTSAPARPPPGNGEVNSPLQHRIDPLPIFGCCPDFGCSAGFQPAKSRQDGGATFKLGQHQPSRGLGCA